MSKIKLVFLLAISIASGHGLTAQTEDNDSKLTFTGDFRFRAEPDWNSRKADGTYRENRMRLRYRVRFGAAYEYNEHFSLGIRIRTGNPIKQQDPQLTLGNTDGEFGTLPLGFEKIYLKGEFSGFEFWLGKNDFPFKKQNELFWSDNVYPEGVSVNKAFSVESGFFNSLKLSAGHFIISHGGTTLGNDNYMQGFQVHAGLLDRIDLFPSLYLFRNTPNIPDGFESYVFDYTIFHMGASFLILEDPYLKIGADYYQNLENYTSNDSIPGRFRDQRQGFNVGLTLGRLQKEGDWCASATYNYQEQYSAVDFLAQNDWARWDYSSYGSPDGRLTNYQGLELVGKYMINKKFTFTVKYYKVHQILSYGDFRETGDRIRFDIDIGF